MFLRMVRIRRGTIKLKESLVKMDEETKKVGLIINEDIIEYLVRDRSQGSKNLIFERCKEVGVFMH